ncbi:MAG TPA: 3'-5' exonuclease [Bacteroidales bacterium]|jgi:inhibitor of KinA sporulation pathway (predicted exonuclease)|nr:3'-5' exonuclease [Bacteroidales bacterium]
MNYIIVDLEATCWEDSDSLEKMEMIEIGAVLMGGDPLRQYAEKDIFVKPAINPELSIFCMTLTNIRQHWIDEADTYPEAFREFIEWIGTEHFKLCSWGEFDFDLFNLENQRHSTRFPENFSGHINLKTLFAEAFNSKPGIGLKAAMRKLGITFHGTPHRGIDDARNIATLAERVLVLDY